MRKFGLKQRIDTNKRSPTSRADAKPLMIKIVDFTSSLRLLVLKLAPLNSLMLPLVTLLNRMTLATIEKRLLLGLRTKRKLWKFNLNSPFKKQNDINRSLNEQKLNLMKPSRN